MDRTAVFVDAGYLFASGSRLIANAKLLRSELHLDHEGVLGLLTELARELTGLPLLRIYWYDGASLGPTPQQLALAYRPNLKLRLGQMSSQGEQHGVDSLLVADLIGLARNRAMSDALLMTGDDDIRVGVEQAQELGVRVHLLGIAPSRENQARSLVQEADSFRELSEVDVRTFLSLSSTASASSPAPIARTHEKAAGPTLPDLEAVAKRMVMKLTPEELQTMRDASEAGSVPAQIDRRLLMQGSSALGDVDLTSDQKRQLRAAFLVACRAR